MRLFCVQGGADEGPQSRVKASWVLVFIYCLCPDVAVMERPRESGEIPDNLLVPLPRRLLITGQQKKRASGEKIKY